jgi:hypothetical protein
MGLTGCIRAGNRGVCALLNARTPEKHCQG